MVNSYILISGIIAVVFILQGSVVLYRNPRSTSNKLFLLFSVAIAIWLIANYLASTREVPYAVAYATNRLVFLFGILSTLALLAFARDITSWRPSRGWKILVAANAIVAVASATPLIVENITAQDKTYAISFGVLSPLYFLILLLNFVGILVILIRARAKVSGTQRAQIDTILASFAGTLAVVLFTNALLPFAFHYYGLTNAGSFATLLLVSGMTYGIIRHRLFDIRLVIARSLAYVLSLASLGAFFILGTFALTSIFFRGTELSPNNTRWIYSLLAVTLAFLFTPLKAFFDKVTARVFFRDSYDTQEFLDQFNKLLVSTYQPIQLLENSAAIITENLKPMYCVFGLNETDTAPRRFIGTADSPKYDSSSAPHLQKGLLGMTEKIVMTDELGDKHADLKRLLRSKDVAIVARLVSGVKSSDTGVGYLLLGPKKSGNQYSTQDLKVIEILTNELVIAIQNSLRFEEIQNFNKTLQGKVVDATRELRRTNEKLKALDETKDDFISMASHQLRTPLTSVKGYLSMVLDGDAGKLTTMERKMLTQAFISSQRMVYLISDLLNVSRLKTGKFVIERTPVNLADMISDEIAQLKETAATRELKLEYDKPKGFPDLAMDETKTRQVVMNFIDNAIYYTPAGGHIKIELADLPSSVELRVVDNGIGVPKGEQHHLFTKFYRAGNARKARPDGTGLGLFMARKVVIAQGGAIIFKSIEHEGSTFGFSFSKTTPK